MNRKTVFYPLSGALSLAGLHYFAPQTLLFYLPVFALACLVRLGSFAKPQLTDQDATVSEGPAGVPRLPGASRRVQPSGARLHAANSPRFDRRHRCA
ncbi:hypothetical protein [Niveibacterium sp. SC-1]|uniref:hypothetical protein n=1 Tax=Niveibacterium sp. SC-1 TaxID=3135646 RepID=UPI00311DD165